MKIADFSDKVAIVTGASEGIGYALAKGLVDAGARVLLVARRTEPLQKAAEQMGERACWFATDVSAENAGEEVVAAAIEHFGGLDYLVNNAGLNLPAAIGDYTFTGWHRMIDLNLIGTAMLTQAAVSHLATRKGAILNVSSAGSRKVIPGNGPYSATKVALNFLTATWAAELADRGIRVNGISPASTETPQFRKVADSIEGFRDMAVQLHHIRRMCAPEELVPPALLLLSDEVGGFITGTVLDVDGGVHI